MRLATGERASRCRSCSARSCSSACWSIVTTIALAPAVCTRSRTSWLSLNASFGYSWNQSGPFAAVAIFSKGKLETLLTI